MNKEEALSRIKEMKESLQLNLPLKERECGDIPKNPTCVKYAETILSEKEFSRQVIHQLNKFEGFAYKQENSANWGGPDIIMHFLRNKIMRTGYIELKVVDEPEQDPSEIMTERRQYSQLSWMTQSFRYEKIVMEHGSPCTFFTIYLIYCKKDGSITAKSLVALKKIKLHQIPEFIINRVA